MTQVMTTWKIVRWLHLLAMAFFVGGQMFLVAAVVPSLRGGEEDRVRLRAIARRFGWGSLVALPVLLATGAAMASHFHRWGRRHAAREARARGPRRRPGPLAPAPSAAALARGAVFVVSLVIVWLGLSIAH